MKLETFILTHLLINEEYARKCIPFLKKEYFKNKEHAQVYDLIFHYINTYNEIPTKEALYIDLSNLKLGETLFESCKDLISELSYDQQIKTQYLVDKTEKFCQERAIHNALLESIHIAENKKQEAGQIPEILKEALAVSFDSNIGHNFLDDWEERYEFYTNVEKRKPFGLQLFNTVTGGGIPPKTLTVGIAGTGVGKSRWMCFEAACDLEDGRNVLYITLEMADWKIAERIDANLLDVNINELKNMEKEEYYKRIQRIHTSGKLIIKEYPTGSASVLNFKHLINELALKKNFVPDVIYIDYINICASSRIRRGSTTSYEYIKAIAEELRSLGVECNVPIITATQTNRTGYSSSDVDLTDTAESFGLPATADFMFALISTPELTELNQQMIKQLKNRLGDPTYNTRFVIGIDKLKMRYYDVDNSAQENILDGPVMDNTNFGKDFDREKFNDFF